MFTTTHIVGNGGVISLRRRPAALLVALVALVSAGAMTQPARTSPVSTSYAWPLEPFHRPHPVRGNFGDPRTNFHGPATHRGLMTASGSFTFHFGIDIAAPNGTPVYAVRSGVASFNGRRNVRVDAGDGTTFEYWHLAPAVRAGQTVVAYETVLGHVTLEHLHFSEFDHGRAINPLAPGHLAPYTDYVAPRVKSIAFRQGDIGEEVLPELVRGRVVPVAEVYDVPAEHVPGMWSDLPVAPALITWRVERAKDGAVVIPEETAFDVRETFPPNNLFWRYYARGTRQNMCPFGTRRAWRVHGVYLYKLGQTPFDTTRLANGIYTMEVTATDIRGNRGVGQQVFILRNGQV
jgi:peptidase M23-like protein